MSYIAKLPTPIFNTPLIPFDQLPLKKDEQGRLVEIETIAFPNTKFHSLKQISENIIQVETSEYPSETPLYVDQRFLKKETSASEREKRLPSIKAILHWMEKQLGLRYFWGGNWAEGIPELLELYPSLKKAGPLDCEDVICRGLDCSGLLYQATNGYTPRNTSNLIQFGKEVLLSDIKPLDLFAWKGHVLIVQSPMTLIESRINYGVVVSSLKERLEEIKDLLQKQNKTLYLRRWHPDS